MTLTGKVNEHFELDFNAVWPSAAVFQRFLKQVEKIKATAVRKRIFTEVQSLAYFPDCQGVKKLANHAYGYRLRVGDYRVFFEFDGSVHVFPFLNQT